MSLWWKYRLKVSTKWYIVNPSLKRRNMQNVKLKLNKWRYYAKHNAMKRIKIRNWGGIFFESISISFSFCICRILFNAQNYQANLRKKKNKKKIARQNFNVLCFHQNIGMKITILRNSDVFLNISFKYI